MPCCSVFLALYNQSALSKERRELQQQQQRTLLEAIPKDLSRPWEDPMPEEGERHLAAVGCPETRMAVQDAAIIMACGMFRHAFRMSACTQHVVLSVCMCASVTS